MTTSTASAAPSSASPSVLAAIAAAISAPSQRVAPASVAAVLRLLDEGATVPFIARYRKELTGSLDEVQIRAIETRHDAHVELEKRRAAVIASVDEQRKLTPALRTLLLQAQTLRALEDLYLPFKQKRRTRASMARERGLQPLADLILRQPTFGAPERDALPFVAPSKDVADVDAALAGARDIVAEFMAERADVRALVRDTTVKDGVVVAKAKKPKQAEARSAAASTSSHDAKASKFDTYKDFAESLARIPSHRVLAVLRGEAEEVLSVSLDVDADRLLPKIEARLGLQRGTPWARQLGLAIDDGYKRLLFPSIETELRGELKARADVDAIDVFAENLAGLLLSAPLGARPVIGIDPGLRTGCKCAVVDGTGRFVTTVTLYLSQGARGEQEARELLVALVKKHHPMAIGVGNGTAGRETEAFVRRTLQDAGLNDVIVTPVNESGASVYSASDIAREEFPDIDLTIRGAISIGRRLQDPLAELVKVDPQAIGVGQYQHDVDQSSLHKALDHVVERCVNQVGVDVNTASAPLLSRVAGIGPALAKKIVQHRESHGVFATRAAIKAVKGLGDRTFEQAAGFLRLRPTSGETSSLANPLDASGVHPERYALVAQMAKDLGVAVAALVGNAALAARIDIERYRSTDVGEPTLRDIVAELGKPGRDPRQQFEAPSFRDDVREMKDLVVGMTLSGVVTNVTAFGAFVDVGVHQDGLVHISQLAEHFVSNPHDVVKAGDRISVRVVEVDMARKRIALSARRG